MVTTNRVIVHNLHGRHDVRVVADRDEADMLYARADSPQATQAARNVGDVAGNAILTSACATASAAAAVTVGPHVVEALQTGGFSAQTAIVGAIAALFTGAGAFAAWRLHQRSDATIDKLATLGVERDVATASWLDRMQPVIGVIRDKLKIVRQACYTVPPTIVAATMVGHPMIGLAIAGVQCCLAARFANQVRSTLSDTRLALGNGINQEQAYQAKVA